MRVLQKPFQKLTCLSKEREERTHVRVVEACNLNSENLKLVSAKVSKGKKQQKQKTGETFWQRNPINLRSLRASDGIAQKPAEGGPGSAWLDPDPQKRTLVLSCPIQIIRTQLLARV